MDCLSSCFVSHGQYQLVYHPVLSVLDNNGWKINLFCLSWTKLVCLSMGFVCPVFSVIDDIGLSVMDSYGWYSTRFCLSWIILVGITSCFVCRGQK